MQQRSALVTGGFGFLGRAVARLLKRRGLRVVGIGHGAWSREDALAHGFDVWRQADVSLSGLQGLDGPFERMALFVIAAHDPVEGRSLTARQTQFLNK